MFTFKTDVYRVMKKGHLFKALSDVALLKK